MTDATPLTAEGLLSERLRFNVWNDPDNEILAAKAANMIDALRSQVASLTAENAALLAANRDEHLHFDTLKADFDNLTADRDLWKSRAEAISKDAADQAIQASRMIATLTAERDAARKLAIDALDPPTGNGWPDDRFEAAEMLHAQRQSWARQERD